MVRLNAPEFGKPIRFKNSPNNDNQKKESQIGANAMVSQFLNVKNNYRQDLESIVGSDNHAHRYFCFDDCAYIFDIDIMKALADTIGEDQGCVVLFQGLRKSPNDATELEKGCSFGRPTLIAAAYKLEGGTLKHVPIPQVHLPEHMREENGDPADGFEHPGNGNSGTPLGVTAPKKHSKVVDKTSQNEDTDYRINKTIDITNEDWK